jgi:CBS domain-containing protein
MSGEATVRTIMTTDVVTLSPDRTVPEAADVLAEHHIGAAPVVDRGVLVGLLRDEDLIVSEAKLHVPTVIEFLGASSYGRGRRCAGRPSSRRRRRRPLLT